MMTLHAEIISYVCSFTGPTSNIPTMANDLGLTTLTSLVAQAGLVDTLSGPGPFTVLAPSNSAFSDVPADILDDLLNNSTALTEVLTYHVLPLPVRSADLSNELLVSTAEGRQLRVNTYPNGVATAQCSPIDLNRVDNEATNGIIHVLNEVMLPPRGTIADIVSEDPAFASLNFAINAADLATTLSGPGPFTLLAPTNSAFNGLDPAQLALILSDPVVLTQVLTYHVVPATLCSAGLQPGAATTVNGGDVTVAVNGAGIFVNDAQVVGADISVSNGVVHAIDRVLIPPGLFPTAV